MKVGCKYTPVLISVYHRLYTLRRCVEALLENPEAKDTDLYVVSDAAGRSRDVAHVAEVRSYVRQISGFRSVNLIARPENWGANRSVMGAIDELLKKHGRLIFMEDDILPSRAYLAYMNQGLRIYENEPRVFAICGYKNTLKLPKTYVHDVFVLPRYSPWGVGFWADKFFAVDHGPTNRYARLQNAHPDVFAFCQKYDPCFLSILKADSEGTLKAADVRIEYHLIDSQQVCLYPSRTMTNVMDSGDDAMHDGMKWMREEQLAVSSPKDMGKIDLHYCQLIYERFLSAKYPSRIKRWSSLLWLRGVRFTVKYFFLRVTRRRQMRPQNGGAE